MKRLIALLLLCTLMLGTVSGALAEDKMKVVGGKLRLRQDPYEDAAVITTCAAGTVVTVLSKLTDWYEVKIPDGRTGYMMASFLAPYTGGGGGGTTPPSAGETAYIVSPDGGPVRMRTGPGKTYSIAGTWKVGTKLTVLSEGAAWDYVQVGSRKGYIMKEFLSSDQPVSPGTPEENSGSAGYKAQVFSNNGYGVRLRAAASSRAKTLGFYSVGTSVTVLKHNKVWDYVRIGTKTGYMMNEFLTTGQVIVSIAGVSLNTTTPKVSTKLTVTVNPSDATVTYEWRDGNDVLLGTAASYVVQSGDVGRKIRVTVTATGNYSGSFTSGYTAQVKP